MTETTPWPRKTRELHNHHFDSTIWNDFRFRDDADVLWTGFRTRGRGHVAGRRGADSPAIPEDAPAGGFAGVLTQGEIHLYRPRRARCRLELPQPPRQRDQTWYSALNDTPGRVGPPIGPPPADVRQYWDSLRTWWATRGLPNVLLVHYSNLKRDLPGQMRRMAEFLDIPVDESRWDTVVEFCSFERMKQRATKSVPLAGAFWDAGAQVFINQGKNGRWNEVLSAAERKEYEDLVVEKLGPECARWLATGEGPTR